MRQKDGEGEESWGDRKRGEEGRREVGSGKEGKSGERRGEEIERKTMWIWGRELSEEGPSSVKAGKNELGSSRNYSLWFLAKLTAINYDVCVGGRVDKCKSSRNKNRDS